MKQDERDLTLFSYFDANELMFNIGEKREWILYELGGISDRLIIMYSYYQNELSMNNDMTVYVLDTFVLNERKTNPLAGIGLNWIYTFWNCTWKEVHTKEELSEALKKLKVKFKLFNINSDFEK